MDEIPSPLGPNLKKHRLQIGMSAEKVGREIDVSGRTIARWEANEHPPSWEHLRKLAKLYGTSVPVLFDQRSEPRESTDDGPVAA